MNNTAVAHPPDLNERILVRELTHRISNQLTSAINVVTAAAVRANHLEGPRPRWEMSSNCFRSRRMCIASLRFRKTMHLSTPLNTSAGFASR